MHKQFKKFGFFAPANTSDTINNNKNDANKINLQFLLNSKDLSGLSKQERHALKKYCKIAKVPTKTKINNEHDKHDENKKHHRSHHHHHKKDKIKALNDGQIFFISPQDIKKHREHKSREKMTSGEHKSKRRHHHHHSKTHNEKSNSSTLIKIENYEGSKLFIPNKNGRGNGDSTPHKSKDRKKSHEERNSGLNSKEIAQIIDKTQNNDSNVASASYNSNSLDDYFIIQAVEKAKKTKDNHNKERHSKDKNKHKSKHNSQELKEVKVIDNSSSIFRNYLSEVHKVLNKNVIDILKIPNDLEAANLENKVDIMFERDNLEMEKQSCDDVLKGSKEQKHHKENKTTTQVSTSSTTLEKKHKIKREGKQKNQEKLESQSNSERMSQRSDKHPRDKKTRTLVQKINSIIEILPSPFYKIDDPIERKKKLLPFQKYYKYSTSSDKNKTSSSDFETITSKTSAFSDSNKMYQPISDQSDTEEDKNKKHTQMLSEMMKQITSSKIPKLRSKTKKLSKSRNSSVERDNCLRISRDEVSRELKTTKTKCKIVENANNLTSFNQISKHSDTTTTCPSIENGDSFTTTTTNSVQVEFIDKKGVETLNTSPVDSYEIVYHENQPTKKRLKKKILKDLSPKNVKKVKKILHSSKSETNLSETSGKKSIMKDKSSNRRSASNNSNSRSVSLDRFGESPRNPTTLLLTKNYKDQDKLNRFQKSRLYSETIRKNLLRNQNASNKIVPPRVLEVRFLTVSNDNTLKGDLSEKHNYVMSPRIIDVNRTKKKVKLPSDSSSVPNAKKSSFKTNSKNKESKIKNTDDTRRNTGSNDNKDNPPEGGNVTNGRDPEKEACIKLISREQFDGLFESPIDETLNAILNENSDFLKKDFSYTVPECFQSCDELDSDDFELKSCKDSSSTRNESSWENFSIDHPSKILHEDSSGANKLLGAKNKFQRYPRARDRRSQEKIAGSSSAPASEESGYSTIRSRENFFETKPIKALIFNNTKIPKILSRRRLLGETSTTSTITSSDLTTKIAKSPHNSSISSVDFNLSQDRMPEVIKFSDESDLSSNSTRKCSKRLKKSERKSKRKAFAKEIIATNVVAAENDPDSILDDCLFDLTDKEDLLDEEMPSFVGTKSSKSSEVAVIREVDDTVPEKLGKKRRWTKTFALIFSCIKKQKIKDN